MGDFLSTSVSPAIGVQCPPPPVTRTKKDSYPEVKSQNERENEKYSPAVCCDLRLPGDERFFVAVTPFFFGSAESDVDVVDASSPVYRPSASGSESRSSEKRQNGVEHILYQDNETDVVPLPIKANAVMSMTPSFGWHNPMSTPSTHRYRCAGRRRQEANQGCLKKGNAETKTMVP